MYLPYVIAHYGYGHPYIVSSKFHGPVLSAQLSGIRFLVWRRLSRPCRQWWLAWISWSKHSMTSWGHGTVNCFKPYLRILFSLQSLGEYCWIQGHIVLGTSFILCFRHWITIPYSCFTMAYFYVDCYTMFMAFWYKKHRDRYLKWTEGVVLFIRRDKLMMFHHVVMPAVFLPALLVSPLNS